MRQLILGTMTAALVTLGPSAAAFAAPYAHEFERDAAISHTAQWADHFYWNHHRYAHRDWDRDHRRWHYYD